MYDLAEFRNCLERAAGLLRTCEVQFFLTGGGAAIANGDPRMTQDIDLVIDPVAIRQKLSTFVEHLQRERFLFNEQTIRTAVASGRQFQLMDVESTLKLGLYPRELVASELGRAVLITILPGLVLPVVSRADFVVSKLIWIRKGNHKSRRDVKQIILRVTETETTVIHAVAARMHLRTLLDEVLAEPDEIDA